MAPLKLVTSGLAGEFKMSISQSYVKHLLIGVTVVLLVNLAGCDEPQVAAPVVRPVLAIMVGEGSTIGGRTYHGRAQAIQSANLAFNVSGSLIERPVKVGESVTTGQLLARLDPRDYQSKFNAAQAQLTKDKANFKRAKELVKKHHISEAEYDKLKAVYEVAIANLDTARKALSETDLKAPFDGKISELFVKNFTAVLAKQQIARLVDVSRIEMIVNVPEALIAQVPEVKSVLVHFDAFPQHDIKATIKEIGTEASKTTHTYPVTLVMDQPEGFTILPGMAGEARADMSQISEEIKQQGSKIEVPLAAVFSPGESNEKFVWVVDEQAGTVSRRAVITGILKSTGLIIEEGLTAGEWIAIAGVHRLREGQSVRLRPAQGE